MANLTFPTNPNNGQKYTFNGKVFEYSSSTGRWSATRLQVLGDLSSDFTIDAPTLGVSLSTVALDTVGANVYITYTVDQDVKASLTTSGLENTTATLHQTNNTIVVAAGATEFANGQINLVVSNGRTTDTETISVSTAYASLDFSTLSLSADKTPRYNNNLHAVDFNSDGTIMFINGLDDVVRQYTLSPAYNLSSATSSSFTYNIGFASGRGLRVKPDGTMFFTCARNTATVHAFVMSTPFDVSSASYDHGFSFSAETSYAQGIDFKPDGTELYIASDNTNSINQYTLSTPWDVRTSTYHGQVSCRTDSNSVAFTPNGDKMFVGYFNKTIGMEQFNLLTPWDVTTATAVGTVSPKATEDGMGSLSEVGAHARSEFLFVAYTNDRVHKYETV